MSQYTYPYGYGSYSGPPPPPSQQQQQLYGYQPPAQYPPPVYNQTYDPVAAGMNLAASQNSFNYNANQIPGLGIAAPPIHPSFGAAINANAWTQPPAYPAAVPGLAPPSKPLPTSSTGPHHHTGSWSTSTKPSVPRGGQPPAAPPVQQAKRQPTPSNEIEEGELSEGQFEDLYEPREAAEPTVAPREQFKPSSAANPSQPASAVATPEAGFYGNDDDEGPTAAVKDGAVAADGRERSGSYSPFLSPREIRTENTTPQDIAGNGDGPSSPFLAPNQSAMLKAASNSHPAPLRENGGEQGQTVPGLQFKSRQSTSANAGYQQPKDGAPKPQAFTSLQEMKKEAQKAILRLWPLGVKFQHYIDEGFDEKVIKGLFGDLHLDMPKPVAESQKDSGGKPATAQVTTSTTKPPQPSNTQPSAVNATESASKPEKPSQGEERKDRIARLLAAKAAKAPVANPKPTNAEPTSPQAAPAPVSQPEHPQQVSGSSTPQKSKPWGEKERLLQQKIAALQKSREAQAQKLAAGEPSQRVTGSQAPGATITQPTQPSTSNVNNKVDGVALPALLSPLAAQPNQLATHRKRPVAADFVEYSSSVGPTKRPFGQDRGQSSLIIDVSDGSDDEEMDMDVDSPIEEPLNSRGNSFGQRGPSIRDFPPLTQPPRQFSSPVPMSQTPPNGSMNGRRRETELDLKEKAIQEMRRKIAEAEAKRKAKKSSGSQTPQASQTPELKESDGSKFPPTPQNATDGPSAQLLSEVLSARLPKNSDRPQPHQLEKADRRGRIVSFELPRIDDSLEDKIRRLNQLRDEEQRLQAEIDNELARKRLLTEELEQINTEPSENASQPSGPSPASSSAPQSQPGSGPAEQVTSTSGTPSSSSDQGAVEQSDVASDVSMDEDQSSRESSESPTSNEEPTGHQHTMAEAPSVDIQSESAANSVEPQRSNPPEADKEQADVTSNQASGLGEDANANMEVSAPTVVDEQPIAAATGAGDATEADDTQKGLEKVDQTTSVAVYEAASLSPSQPASTGDHVSADEATEGESEVEQLDQISTVGQPREDVQEIEDAQMMEGVVTEMAPTPSRGSEHAFHPYSSPLRYFRAYRYHPDYPNSVAGGLKSLTYSNRIDPQKAMCPYELSGQQCPAGCEFQHFSSIIVPDDLILVELGSAEDYTGDQKNKFITGLRELLGELRVKKVKDFDVIARGIIDYRASLLGDKSKILPLGDVTL